MSETTGPESLFEDLRQVSKELGHAPSVTEYIENGAYPPAVFYRRVGSFTRARERAGLTPDPMDRLSDDKLLRDLRSVDAQLDKTVSGIDYAERGEHSTSALRGRFGSLPDAREIAGIDGDPGSEPVISDQELLDDIEAVFEQIGEPPSEDQYRAHGTHDCKTLRRRFGSVRQAREQADIPNPDKRGGQNRVSRQELEDAILKLKEELGRVPKRNEMLEQGAYSLTPYHREFGGWNDALRAVGLPINHGYNVDREEYDCQNCGETVERLPSRIQNQRHVFCSPECKGEYYFPSGEDNPRYERETVACANCGTEMERKPAEVADRDHLFCGYDCYGEWCSAHRTHDEHPRWKGGGELYRGPNWLHQRDRRLEHDDRTCQYCGITEEEHIEQSGMGLSVHHVTPVREFYAEEGDPDWEAMNALDNLVTVCRSCHGRWEGIPVQPQLHD